MKDLGNIIMLVVGIILLVACPCIVIPVAVIYCFCVAVDDSVPTRDARALRPDDSSPGWGCVLVLVSVFIALIFVGTCTARNGGSPDSVKDVTAEKQRQSVLDAEKEAKAFDRRIGRQVDQKLPVVPPPEKRPVDLIKAAGLADD